MLDAITHTVVEHYCGEPESYDCAFYSKALVRRGGVVELGSLK